MATGTVMPPDVEQEGVQVPLTPGALSAIEEGDRRSMVATAKENPRSIQHFRKELLELVTLDEKIAQEMSYSLPRGDKQLIGPSIRFAEAVVYCFRNLRAGVQVIDEGDKTLTAEGRIYDAERNTGIAIRVDRNITGKRGRFNQDMIAVTGAAASAIAYRNAVLKYVPKGAWIDIWEQAKQTAVGKGETMGKKRMDAVAYFGQLGITEVMVLNTLGVRGVEDIQTDELVALKAWAREIKAGSKSIEDIFGSPLDEEIERTMKALGWNETQKRLSRTNFAGNREGHLAYVKGEAAKANITVEGIHTVPKTETKAPPAPKEADTTASTGTTAEASTSPASEPAKAETAKPAAAAPKSAPPADW